MAKRPFRPNQLGLFRPESEWRVPTELPDLRGRPLVALDTENRDDGLARGLGPGWALGQAGGYLCGVAWSAEGSQGYAPVRHPDTDCLPLDNVLRWVRDLVRSGTRVVFHNSPYDVGWLGTYDVPPPSTSEDTQCAAVMLDETHRWPETYSLDDCCRRAGVPGKDTALLREAVEAYGGDPRKPAAYIHLLPARYAGPYAEQDATATRELLGQQEGALRAQGVWDAYRTEMELVPMIVAMRRRGIRLDMRRVSETSREFRRRRDAALATITRGCTVGRAVTIDDVRSPTFLARVLEAEGIRSPARTATGRDSFSKDWMERHEHWLPRAVTDAVRYEDAATKFMDNFLAGFAQRGRLHAEVHQFLGEDGGARSHRFSYSDPPLQQMPSPDRDPRDAAKQLIEDRAVGTLVRRCFLPEEGDFWAALDYSQQEPRITVHFAAACGVRGAQAAVDRYHDDPRTDYHQMVADMTGLPRPRAKILNLAMTYGKGKDKTAEELGISVGEAEVMLETYHQRLPFIRALDGEAKRRASERGYIRLIDGARMRYTEWEGGWIDWDVRRAAQAAGKKMTPCSLEEARARQQDPDHPWARTRLRRADVRKALNNLVQGSAARQTKRAMLAMWREGILPLIQMHDEVGISTADERVVLRASQLMTETTPLLVPVVVDAEVGRNWGEAKMSWADCVARYGRAA